MNANRNNRQDKLSAVALRNPAPGRHRDGLGLYLEVTDAGGRYWRMRYRFSGSEKLLALGVFPDVSLKAAREARDKARDLLREGIDPGERKRAEHATRNAEARSTFARSCTEWLAFKGKSWSPESARKAAYVTRVHLLPKLGKRSIATLASKDVTPVLRKMADTTPELARKARQYLQGIVKHAIREGLREDGRLLMLDGVLPKADKGHIPASTLPDEIAAVMRAVRDYPMEVTRSALLMCACTAQRPGVVVAMRWDELALDLAEWQIPAAKMKTGNAHIVPLPTQALALIEAMRAYSAGRDYVFPPLARQSTPHLHRDALSKALRGMGLAGRHATHGFRGMLRTAGRERLGIAADVLEAQLAHAKRGDVQKAYDRTAFTEERCKAMQRWCDWLDALALPASVTPIRGQRAASAA